MLRSLDDIIGYRLSADDGRIGKVADFYFDDRDWTIRYLVADTGRWLPGRKVLISPMAIGYPDGEDRSVRVGLTQEQIEEGPSIAIDRPMTREEERRYAEHFGWPLYWELGTAWTMDELPPIPPEDVRRELDVPDADLRSVRDVLGYDIRDASGAHAGEVEDAIVDTDGWRIVSLVGRIRVRLLGRARRVLIPPKVVREVDWYGRHLVVELDREELYEGEAYDPDAPVNHDYEQRLFDYRGRQVAIREPPPQEPLSPAP